MKIAITGGTGYIGSHLASFLNYKNFLWLKICSLFCLLLIVLYYLDDPIGERSGGSVLGYTYGVIATAGILYLLYFGIRKRSYYNLLTPYLLFYLLMFGLVLL